jgi:hypothetical protein
MSAHDPIAPEFTTTHAVLSALHANGEDAHNLRGLASHTARYVLGHGVDGAGHTASLHALMRVLAGRIADTRGVDAEDVFQAARAYGFQLR